MINILIESIIITSKILDVEEMFKHINNKSLVLSSKEEINKWSIERAKRLNRNWWKEINHFKKGEKLYRYAFYGDVLTVVSVLRYLKEDKKYKFLFESENLLDEILTESSDLEKFNLAKIEAPLLNKTAVLMFNDKLDFKKKLNSFLDLNIKEPKHIHRHHYDTIQEEFKNKYNGNIEFAIMI